MNTSETTRTAHAEGYVRQYWLQKQDGIPLVSLLDRTGDLLSEELFVEYSTGQLEPLSVYR